MLLSSSTLSQLWTHCCQTPEYIHNGYYLLLPYPSYGPIAVKHLNIYTMVTIFFYPILVIHPLLSKLGYIHNGYYLLQLYPSFVPLGVNISLFSLYQSITFNIAKTITLHVHNIQLSSEKLSEFHL